MAGDLPKALADCKKAMDLNPYQADAYALIGDVLKRVKRGGEAAGFEERAKKLGWHAPEQALPVHDEALTKDLTVPELPPFAVLKAVPFTLVDPDAAP
jgi:hypothetical protein